MTKQIEILKALQVKEELAGFPNGELYNDLQDQIMSLELSSLKAKITRHVHYSEAEKPSLWKRK
jgi:hypothetical protein